MPLARKMAVNLIKVGELQVGDLVLAKVKGFSEWPAKIGKPEEWEHEPDPKKFFVEFFGTREIAFIAPADIQLFTQESRSKLIARCKSKPKPKSYAQFMRAVKEICEVFEELQQISAVELVVDNTDQDSVSFATSLADNIKEEHHATVRSYDECNSLGEETHDKSRHHQDEFYGEEANDKSRHHQDELYGLEHRTVHAGTPFSGLKANDMMRCDSPSILFKRKRKESNSSICTSTEGNIVSYMPMSGGVSAKEVGAPTLCLAAEDTGLICGENDTKTAPQVLCSAIQVPCGVAEDHVDLCKNDLSTISSSSHFVLAEVADDDNHQSPKVNWLLRRKQDSSLKIQNNPMLRKQLMRSPDQEEGPDVTFTVRALDEEPTTGEGTSTQPTPPTGSTIRAPASRLPFQDQVLKSFDELKKCQQKISRDQIELRILVNSLINEIKGISKTIETLKSSGEGTSQDRDAGEASSGRRKRRRDDPQ